MKSKSRNGQRHNALKHGAFAKELFILDENKNVFDEMHIAGGVNVLSRGGD
ncbi:MAG: hypothetical protein ACM3IH_05570 [Sphingobacteriales bacterium]|jgi:hypothetical protein